MGPCLSPVPGAVPGSLLAITRLCRGHNLVGSGETRVSSVASHAHVFQSK